MKKSKKLFGMRDFALFLCSFFISLGLISAGILYFSHKTNSNETALAGIEAQTDKGVKNILFCDVDNNVSYEFELDFEEVRYDVKRVYIDNEIYKRQGLSGLKSYAETFLQRGVLYIIVATETQHAALIDYVGGVSRDIDERLSVICNGISVGYHNLSGIAAINLYGEEASNNEMCLSITEEVFIKWCRELNDEATFFKLLDLTDNNISYVDFVHNRDKISEMFKG